MIELLIRYKAGLIILVVIVAFILIRNAVLEIIDLLNDNDEYEG